MKHIAYGNIAQRNEEKEVIIDSLKKMNCPVFIESDIDNRREKWTEFIDILQEGDTAIIYSFSNTFVNYHDMIFFLKYCFTQDIRIVSFSIHRIYYFQKLTQRMFYCLFVKCFFRRKRA